MNGSSYYEDVFWSLSLDEGCSVGIYGTGNGADILLKIFNKTNKASLIKAFIDNDIAVKEKKCFKGYRLLRMDDAYHQVDVIIVAAIRNHKIVYNRVVNFIDDKGVTAKIKVIDFFAINTPAAVWEYMKYVEKYINKEKSDEFVEKSQRKFVRGTNDTKLIAWYLPQFHQMEINDKFYGKGFTEWTNTSQAIPVFTGHYQPHIPFDVGYYDLNNISTMAAQIDLAKYYGVYGFSFYFYWFSGKRIMEKPVENFLKHTELDMPFCLTWANENWSALWDAGNKELIFEQHLSDEDDERIMEDLLPYFKDKRYITINGNPVFIVYRPAIWAIERVRILFNNFRKIAKRNGLSGLYIMVANAGGFDEDVAEWGADALVEFPPHGIGSIIPEWQREGYLNPDFLGTIKDAKEFIKKRQYLVHHASTVYYRGVMPGWDNTARKATTGATVFTGLKPDSFKKWLKDVICESNNIHKDNNNFVFINSWNEWAEGAHLEPDIKYGYAYLQAVKEAMEETRKHK